MKHFILFSILLIINFIPNAKAQTTLKAVLVVGPLEDATQNAIKNMEEVATLMKKNGVKVQSFYNEKSVWEDICNASAGVHFFIYAGHGVNYGEGGTSGGLYLAKGKYISSKQIENDLKLRSEAIVLFKSVCMGAGSSASDNYDIGIDEAVTRVINYARPFFKLNAACYYANNWDGGINKFLDFFFRGKTIRECYQATLSNLCKPEIKEKCVLGKGLEIQVSSTNFQGDKTRTRYINGEKKVEVLKSFKEYTLAYIGYPNKTIKELWNTNPLVVAKAPKNNDKKLVSDNQKRDVVSEKKMQNANIKNNKYPNKENEIKTVSSNNGEKQNSQVKMLHHIIVGSYSRELAAESVANDLKKKGYASTSILIYQEKFRISIKSYSDLKLAEKELIDFRAKFQDAWICNEE